MARWRDGAICGNHSRAPAALRAVRSYWCGHPAKLEWGAGQQDVSVAPCPLCPRSGHSSAQRACPLRVIGPELVVRNVASWLSPVAQAIDATLYLKRKRWSVATEQIRAAWLRETELRDAGIVESLTAIGRAYLAVSLFVQAPHGGACVKGSSRWSSVGSERTMRSIQGIEDTNGDRWGRSGSSLSIRQPRNQPQWRL